MCHITRIHFEKCVVRRFCSCASIIECTYTNLHGTPLSHVWSTVDWNVVTWCMTVIKVRILAQIRTGSWVQGTVGALTRNRKGETQRHMEGKVIRRWKERSKRCNKKPRNVKGCQPPAQARRKVWNGLALSTSTRSQPCQHLYLVLLAAKTVREFLIFNTTSLW